MPLLSLVLTLLAGLPGGQEGSQLASNPVQTVCPPDDRYTRWALDGLLRDEQAKAVAGLTGVGADQLRVLTDAQDRAVCQRFKDNIRSVPVGATAVQWGYYQAGNFYLVVVSQTSPAVIGHSGLRVFDRNFQQVSFIML